MSVGYIWRWTTTTAGFLLAVQGVQYMSPVLVVVGAVLMGLPAALLVDWSKLGSVWPFPSSRPEPWTGSKPKLVIVAPKDMHAANTKAAQKYRLLTDDLVERYEERVRLRDDPDQRHHWADLDHLVEVSKRRLEDVGYTFVNKASLDDALTRAAAKRTGPFKSPPPEKPIKPGDIVGEGMWGEPLYEFPRNSHEEPSAANPGAIFEERTGAQFIAEITSALRRLLGDGLIENDFSVDIHQPLGDIPNPSVTIGFTAPGWPRQFISKKVYASEVRDDGGAVVQGLVNTVQRRCAAFARARDRDGADWADLHRAGHVTTNEVRVGFAHDPLPPPRDPSVTQRQ